MADPTEEITTNSDEEEEEETALAFQAEQELNLALQQVRQLYEEGQRYKKPSLLKYSFLFTVAGIIDVVDFLDLTGLGIIIAKIVSIAGTGIIYFTLWLTDSRLKKAHELVGNLEKAILEVQQKVARVSSFAMKSSKFLGKVPGMKGLARKIPRAMVGIRRLARKNPLTKVLIGGAINLVPFLAMINLMVVWIWLTRHDEKKAFKQARETSEEAIKQSSQTVEATRTA